MPATAAATSLGMKRPPAATPQQGPGPKAHRCRRGSPGEPRSARAARGWAAARTAARWAACRAAARGTMAEQERRRDAPARACMQRSSMGKQAAASLQVTVPCMQLSWSREHGMALAGGSGCAPPAPRSAAAAFSAALRPAGSWPQGQPPSVGERAPGGSAARQAGSRRRAAARQPGMPGCARGWCPAQVAVQGRWQLLHKCGSTSACMCSAGADEREGLTRVADTMMRPPRRIAAIATQGRPSGPLLPRR